jgi:hypothetical protein
MIIMRSTSETGQELLLFGLSRENVTRLLEGDPILLTRQSHGVPEGWSVGIFFGETEQDMAGLLSKMGIITPQTEVVVDPKLTPQKPA